MSSDNPPNKHPEAPQPILLKEKFRRITEFWSPRIAAEFNGQQLRLARLKGEFVWHKHDNEDELFLVVDGVLEIQFRGSSVTLNPGEAIVIPRGVEHRPVAKSEVDVVLIEPASTVNTGDSTSNLTRHQLDWI